MLDSVIGNREVEHGVEVQPTIDVCSVGLEKKEWNRLMLVGFWLGPKAELSWLEMEFTTSGTCFLSLF
jgi:hypothetical protein